MFNALSDLAKGAFDTMFGWARQKYAWLREDTAVQRRVADMRAAGINPILAAGSPAQTMGPASLPGAGAIESPRSAATDAIEGLAITRAKEEIASTRAGRQLAEAQKRKVGAETLATELGNQYLSATMGPRVAMTGKEVEYLLSRIRSVDQGTANAKLDGLIKELEIPKAAIEAQRAAVGLELDKLGLAQGEKDLVLKSLAIEMRQLELEQARYNFEWAERVGFPAGPGVSFPSGPGGFYGAAGHALGTLAERGKRVFKWVEGLFK